MRSILITGCNRGLGLGLVQHLTQLPNPPEKIFATCRDVNKAETFAEELLKVSDKYQLLGLKEICEESLSETISVENSIRILILADLHDSKKLVEFAKNYIVTELASLKNTEEYKALEESHLALFVALLKEHLDKFSTN
ncbi:Similar to Tdpoz5: TD and POZ domain-containing protein 5 (Mus musculus) [Cotesia congregata]|uniref:Similar to Tdpoz5: TD and POZ domain-containing protein 5 (Mus musculus) n=1 Tax=Cotesia congregata TaxID=51543 RepID=A0A8J2MFP8_COTCN|nr:Similar to Tdpoz5: TD and POZ domain-containing protein 5 (Mus musculus) [Cotesia congregata]